MDDISEPSGGPTDDSASEDGEEIPGAQPLGGSVGPRRLRRSTTDHMLAGVAGGIAEYLNVDPIIVRIAFVVLTLFGGVGLVLYGSGWLLMSDRDRPTSARELFHGSRRQQAILAVATVLVGIVILDFLSKGPFWIGTGWRVGQAFGWIVVAGIVGYLVLRGVRGPFSLRRITRRVGISFFGLVACSLVVGVGAELLTGVPLSGGFGSRTWRPTSVRQIASVYRVGIGTAVLDLGQVHFPDRATRVTVSVGVGHLIVEVPSGVTVSLTARSGIGDVVYGSGGESDFLGGGRAGSSATSATASLVLDAQTGIGEVELVRTAPGTEFAIAPGV